MIKIGIDGAGSPEGGELIRLLINHPDVELCQIAQPQLVGRKLSDVHHGMQGEKELTFVSRLDTEALDILFYTSTASDSCRQDADDFIASKADSSSGFAIFVNPDSDLLDSSAPFFPECPEPDESADVSQPDWASVTVFGVPELNRKPLVRGARKVVIPTAAESLAAVALLPFSSMSAVSGSLLLTYTASEEILEKLRSELSGVQNRLCALLSEMFGRKTEVDIALVADAAAGRCMRLHTDIAVSCTTDELRKVVATVYDDHNLAHLSVKPLDYREVEGTDNCLISLEKNPRGGHTLEAIADARLRGGAGEAVHVMNLFAGLFEKTGLQLKASRY